ncbi:hypothetical protein [Pendulispora albinea]|uniref:Uncharacterized protein n=1 Tax=Pendulispora albinea TaxID=2741071 RepID=A0ABZ2M386_9BACT
MKTRVEPRLLEEAQRFAFRFACEDCVHFLDSHQCAHGYPPAPRRSALTGAGEGATPIAPEAEITFCKEFELR